MLITLLLTMAALQSPDVGRVTLKSGVDVQTVKIQLTGPAHKTRKFVQEDFSVFEDGVQQPIALFTKNTDDSKGTRYEIGYAVTPSQPGEKKRIEVKIRGFNKKKIRDFISK